MGFKASMRIKKARAVIIDLEIDTDYRVETLEKAKFALIIDGFVEPLNLREKPRINPVKDVKRR